MPHYLGAQLPLSGLTTFLLDVFQRQAAKRSPAELLAAYRQNRFVKPSAVDPVSFREFELLWLKTARQQGFQALELSPVAPLGACSAVGTVHQNKVLSALRGTEVVADATNVLALESSVVRQAAGFPAKPLHYCTVHRHVRTQVLNFPGFTPHFSIFCLTSAGRDAGHFQFEKTTLTQHIALYVQLLTNLLGKQHLTITLKALDPDDGANLLFEAMLERVQDRFSDLPIDVQRMPRDRQQYYRSLQFGITINHQGQSLPIADGGFTSWTRQLTGNKKERFLSSGIGLELLWKLLNAKL